MAGQLLSQHPAGRLVRELVRTRRAATTDDVWRIIERMAMAPFDRSINLVPASLRGVAYQHYLLGTREDAIIDHLAKRVVGERRPPDSSPMVLIVYSADRGIILSGYQVSSLDRTGIPQEARWLK